MSGYTQLTREQRYQIQALMKTGQNQTQMATVLDVHKATISRELRRNRGLRGYGHTKLISLHKLGRRGNHARASPLVCGNRWKR
jgi:IS30 family transposase